MVTQFCQNRLQIDTVINEKLTFFLDHPLCHRTEYRNDTEKKPR